MSKLVKKKLEIGIAVFCLLSGSVMAYLIDTQRYERELADKREEHRMEIQSIVETYRTKLDNLQKETEETELPEQITKSYPGDSYSDKIPYLSESDEKFLKEHVYGMWRFVERVYATDAENEKFNFTDQGVESIEDTLFVLEISDDTVWFETGASHNDFSDANDFSLFVKSGGLQIVDRPVWECVDTEDGVSEVFVYNMETEQYDAVAADALGKLGYVRHTCGFDVRDNPSYRGALLCTRIYPDLENADVLYVDFGGLWKLERY